MTRLQNLGISPIQTMVGLIFSVFGFVVYYFVPMSIFFKNLDLFFFLILGILFMMIVGMIFLAQLFISTLEKLLLSTIIFFFRPQDKKLKPIVLKNLESHSPRNSKTSMMFTIAVTFLIMSGSAFSQIEHISLSLTRAIVNADIALFIANVIPGSAPLSLKEA